MAENENGSDGESTIPGEDGTNAQKSVSTGENGESQNKDDAADLKKTVESLKENYRKIQSERDKAQAKLEAMEKFQQQFADKSLNEKQQQGYQEKRKELIARINENWDGETAVSLLEKVVVDAEDGATRKVEPQIQSLKSEIAELKRVLKESNPERQKYSQRIAELREELPDVDDDVLLKIAKREGMKNATKPADAPGNTATHRNGSIGSEVKLTDEQEAMIRTMYPKATKEELMTVAKIMAAKRGNK